MRGSSSLPVKVSHTRFQAVIPCHSRASGIHSAPPVIPAKAGIHSAPPVIPEQAEIHSAPPVIPEQAGIHFKHESLWIPASAGMTIF